MSIACFALLPVRGCNPILTHALLTDVAGALTGVLAGVVAAWHPYDGLLVPPTVRAVEDVGQLTDNDTAVILSATIDEKNDEAYHYQRPDPTGMLRPYIVALAGPAQSLADITTSIGHEGAETVLDWTCTRVENGLALENSDPAEGLTIRRGGFVFAAYVGPAWFGVGTGPVCYSDEGATLKPGVPGPMGYALRADGSEVPGGCRIMRTHPLSRYAWRMRGLAAAASAAVTVTP